MSELPAGDALTVTVENGSHVRLAVRDGADLDVCMDMTAASAMWLGWELHAAAESLRKRGTA